MVDRQATSSCECGHQRAWFDARVQKRAQPGAIASSVLLFPTGRGAVVPVARSADVFPACNSPKAELGMGAV
jgi:hypothetical protein